MQIVIYDMGVMLARMADAYVQAERAGDHRAVEEINCAMQNLKSALTAARQACGK